MKLITKAKDCNIKTFIDCKFENNFEGLILEGEPSISELMEAWDMIAIEYIDLSGVELPELEKKKKIYEIDLSIKCCNLCFLVLDTSIRELSKLSVDQYTNPDRHTLEFKKLITDAIPTLKQNGVSLTWRNDVPDFEKQLNSARIQYKLKYVRLEEVTKELEQVQQSGLKPETIKDFYRLINNIEALTNIKIDENIMNLARFAVLISDYRSMIARQSPS